MKQAFKKTSFLTNESLPKHFAPLCAAKKPCNVTYLLLGDCSSVKSRRTPKIGSSEITSQMALCHSTCRIMVPSSDKWRQNKHVKLKKKTCKKNTGVCPKVFPQWLYMDAKSVSCFHLQKQPPRSFFYGSKIHPQHRFSRGWLNPEILQAP